MDDTVADDLDQIAIIGMSGRFPDAPDIATFWANLRQGREGISRHTTEELLDAGVAEETVAEPNFVPAKGVLADADQFDAGLFDYSPREAEIMDPQHRVFLECAWEALESAGCDPRTFTGRIGVFAGSTLNTYMIYNVMANRRAFAATGMYQTLLASDKDFLATRVAYKLNLRGPAVTVQTACSTSLTAVHLASQSLLNGECDIALAGGVSVTVPLRDGYTYEKGGILSADGHCRPFDAAAGGTVASNGAGIVVLRKLDDARAAGNVVDAVILGSAINNDGSLKAGYTAPSVDGQAEVIAEALAVSDVDASTIGYVETHGTGTKLGDPIEVAALTKAYREHTGETGFCGIGSVKSNIGHTDAAAGVTALIKAALVLKHGEIPPSLHVETPNPELSLDTSPFYVCDELRPWPRRDGTPRRVGVSSFGIGGTNAHAVLEEAPEPAPSTASARSEQLLVLSGRTTAALTANAARLADHLEANPDTDLADVAFTLATGRGALDVRGSVTAADPAAAVTALRGIAGRSTVDGKARVAFLFPGQGAQYVQMARGLYAGEPAFTAAFDRCADLFAEHDVDLRSLVFGDDADAERLAQTQYTQPALFAVEYALAQLWTAWGVRPAAMAGHSIGELVAACVAGVFALSDAVRLVAARGRLVAAMPTGSMLSVVLPEAELAGWLTDELSLAAVNSTGLCVVSGPAAAIDALAARLSDAGVACRALHTSHAFHSASMAGAVDPFVDVVRSVTLNPPRIPFVSNVTGTWITDEQATDPAYWGRHLREPVRFADAAALLLDDPATVMIEVGPGQTLGTFVRQHARWTDDRAAVASLRHPKEQVADGAYLRRALGAAWSAGVAVDWPAYFAGEERALVRLPGYAFQRQRYWVDPDDRAAGQPVNAPRTESDDWFATPGWRRLPHDTPRGDLTATRWVILGADIDLGQRLANQLAADGAAVVPVTAGTDLVADDGMWRIDPTRRDHYAELLSTLDGPSRVVHAWSLGAAADELTPDTLAAARRVGFDSLLALAQGIGDAGAEVSVDVLSPGVHDVLGTEPLRPEHALLAGVATVLPQEVRGADCRLLDLGDTDDVLAVRDLLAARTTERTLALRGAQWWIRDFDQTGLPGAAPRLRDGGVYLITGGLGGVGLAIAEHIAGAVSQPVIALLGRNASTMDERLTRIRELGAEVLVLRADVTNRADLADAVEAIKAVHGGLHGVVHAAGAPSEGLITTKDAAEADRVLAAKTTGTLVLDDVLTGEELDFVLLCSSVTGVLGGPGQSDYCAANAFLDAFAQQRRRDAGTPYVSVAWDTWQETGMAAGLSARLGGEPTGEPTAHPMLRRLREGTYTATFSTADLWIVADHRIMGHGLVPGTAYLELIRAAIAETQDSPVEIELRDVLFLLPVVVPDGQRRTVYLTVEDRDGEISFAVRSRTGDGGWQDHTTGTAVVREPTEPVVRDLDTVIADCAATEVLDTVEAIRARLPLERSGGDGDLDFAFGPRWRALESIHAGEQRLLATLRLADEFHGDLDGYPLHPALMDLAGGAARLHLRQDVYYLPFTYRSLLVAAPLTPTVHCAITLKDPSDAAGETMTCDVDVLDPAGRLLVRISEFAIKRVHDVGTLLTQVRLAAQDEEPEPERATGTLAELSAGMSVADCRAALARVLAAGSLPANVVVSGKDFAAQRRLAASITPELLEQELAEIAPPAGSHPRPDLATPYVEPSTDDERAVAEIWQDVLGIDRVGVNDDFFALGGHSLAAVQIGAKVKSRFGTELDLPKFFDAPTVANTVSLLAGGTAAGSSDADAIPTLSRADDVASLADLSDDEVEASLRELLAAEPADLADALARELLDENDRGADT
jgi:acyl transferase domain-containing protein/acyl carrier protein